MVSVLPALGLADALALVLGAAVADALAAAVDAADDADGAAAVLQPSNIELITANTTTKATIDFFILFLLKISLCYGNIQKLG